MTEVELTYPWNHDSSQIVIQSDSDWAGCHESRKSISGGAAYMGKCLLKAWSKEQCHIAMSSGEAELYASNKAAAEGLGLKSLAADMGIKVDITVEIDATAAIGIIHRRGLGKVRHLDVQELWCQEAVKTGLFKVRKVDGHSNTADLMTKPLDRKSIESHMARMGFSHRRCMQNEEAT